MSVVGTVLGSSRDGRRTDRLLAAALPVVSIAVLVTFVGAASWASWAQGTLGFDYLSYDGAVRRFLAGGFIYDESYVISGGFGLFYYPPPFLLFAIPLTILPPPVAAIVFTGLLLVTYVVAIAILPVPPTVRWTMLLLGGLSWPLVHAVKLGQVGPVILLCFAIGWRWMDRPWLTGAATAIGTAIKIQPGLLVLWGFLTGRFRFVAATVVVFAVLAVAATVIASPRSWVDQATLLARLSQPIATPHNYTPGRLAFEAGLSVPASWAIQILNWAAVGFTLLYASRRTTAVASYLAFVIASQLTSPILWDHYALMLLLPVAWLCAKGHWWAVLVPLATSSLLVGISPPWFYPIAYWVTMVAVVWLGRSDREALEATYQVPRPVPYATS